MTSWGTRPFSTPEEHNDYLIEQWNKTVPEDGVVFHLGDFCFAGIQQWENIRKRLNDKIHLVLGNHDLYNISTNSERVQALFEDITFQKIINIDGQLIYLNHLPFYACQVSIHIIMSIIVNHHGNSLGMYIQVLNLKAQMLQDLFICFQHNMM